MRISFYLFISLLCFSCALKKETLRSPASVQGTALVPYLHSEAKVKIFQDQHTGDLWSEKHVKKLSYIDALQFCKNFSEISGIKNVAWTLPLYEEYAGIRHKNLEKLIGQTQDLFWTASDDPRAFGQKLLFNRRERHPASNALYDSKLNYKKFSVQCRGSR